MTAENHDTAGRRPDSLADIRETYADQAECFARMDWFNRLFTGRYRRRLFGKAEGRVLDVACGTGTNVHDLPASTDYVGVDISPEMLQQAREQFIHREGQFQEMDAQHLDFPDDSFDTVLSSLSTCTFPDPEQALNEMARVCRPDGRVLLLEHGRSSVEPIGRFQDWRADAHYAKHSCRWNQDPVGLVAGTELSIRSVSTALAGIITAIEAQPPV